MNDVSQHHPSPWCCRSYLEDIKLLHRQRRKVIVGRARASCITSVFSAAIPAPDGGPRADLSRGHARRASMPGRWRSATDWYASACSQPLQSPLVAQLIAPPTGPGTQPGRRCPGRPPAPSSSGCHALCPSPPQDGGAANAHELDTKLMETYVKATATAVADESVHMWGNRAAGRPSKATLLAAARIGGACQGAAGRHGCRHLPSHCRRGPGQAQALRCAPPRWPRTPPRPRPPPPPPQPPTRASPLPTPASAQAALHRPGAQQAPGQACSGPAGGAERG
jgi:hypothetical protein